MSKPLPVKRPVPIWIGAALFLAGVLFCPFPLLQVMCGIYLAIFIVILLEA